MKPRTTLLAAALALILPCAACAVASRGLPSPSAGVSPQMEDVGITDAAMPRPDQPWFHSGWYAGVTVGSAVADASASDIDHALANLGYDTTTELDNTDTGWKLYGGYRFDEPWAIELAIVDLGMVESVIDTDAADMDAFLEDVAKIHPTAGAGVSLTGVYYPIQKDRFDLGLRAGFWVWEADTDVNGALGEFADLEENGNFDPVLGIFGLIDLGGNFSARLEWEHYFMDQNDVDYFAVGIQYTLPL